MNTSSSPRVRRGFVDVDEGQVHFRYAGQGRGRPVVLIHASPGSSLGLEPLVASLASDRYVVAPDTMGNGDSHGSMPEIPDIDFFAQRALEAIDALGIDKFDLYGTHTGASVAAEIAIRNPERVNSLIMDGVGLYSDEMQAELLENYAPAMKPDLHGSHINWAWHFVRDTYMFWPWYRTDAAHRRQLGLPSADVLHGKVVDVLKAIETYHHSYRAAFRFDKRKRFAEISVPTLAVCAASDMLMKWHDEFAALIPNSTKAVIPAVTTDPDEAAAIFRNFLDREL
ncbi:alpha/beta hydrolase [Chelativorans sp. Marseille-P2723]|uniref:alpha/beta fold hydrolase n=1 Tax=Chelativorans sp. Marseille-P2723 TaxID=2709133 RepID=UPI00156F92DA|nr:alpha/beta hydrolase [Chelativorans sp. Marseille-P2723]